MLLDRMFTDGTILYLDRVYVALHSTEFKESDESQDLLLERIKNLGIIVGSDTVDDMIEQGKWIDSL